MSKEHEHLNGPSARLEALMRTVRSGLSHDGNLEEQTRCVKMDLEAIHRQLRRNPTLLNELDQLRLKTLEAEFYQQSGKPTEAAEVLRPVWDNMHERLEIWSPRKLPLEPSGDKKLLRQKLWALLHYVFYEFFRVRQQHHKAIEYFLLLEKIIQRELRTPDYIPHGTLAVCYYFMGLCYRVNRGFSLAERRFGDAQNELHMRTTTRLAQKGISEEERQSELAYKDVFSARILSGLGWVALQQGNLSRAEHILRTASNQLLGTHQQSLKEFVASLLAIVIRRKSPFDTDEYKQAMKQLKTSYEKYRRVDDVTQHRRCASEIVRGYLDLAEFDGDPLAREDHLAKAEQWLRRIETTSHYKNLIRQRLHAVRLAVLKDDLSKARGLLDEAKRLSTKHKIEQRATAILDALCLLRSENPNAALDVLRTVMKSILPVHIDESDKTELAHDPVLESECYLLSAQAYVRLGQMQSAKQQIAKWHMLCRFLENYYLHQFAKTVEASIPKETPFHVPYDFEVYAGETQLISKTLLSRMADFESWLLKTVRERYPALTAEQFAEIHGRSRFTVSRRLRKLPTATS